MQSQYGSSEAEDRSVLSPEPELADPPASPGDPQADYRDRPVAPPLLSPTRDRTAGRAATSIRHAVYRAPTTTQRVSLTTAREPLNPREQAVRDAEGWVSVPER
jgi:hypothetical protein